MSEDRGARRRALIWGIPALACLTAIAALVSIPRVEDDRGAAVLQSLADAGLTELTIDMAGRDAHISSSQTYPEGSNDVIRDLAVQWGVRKADIALLKPAAATATTTTGDSTSSSTSALTSGPTTSRARPAVPVIFAEIGRGEVTLRGSYANNRQHEELLASANTSYGRGNVVDQLRLAGLNEIAPSDGGVTALATALVATETDLVEGLVSFTESRLVLAVERQGIPVKSSLSLASGQSPSSTSPSSSTAPPSTVPASTVPASTTPPAAARDTVADLNRLVQLKPILFQPATAEILSESLATLESAAVLLAPLAGVA